MIRPPPLQLKLDNRFPQPVRSTPAPRTAASFVSQLYKANWKNFVIAVAGLNALRFAYASYNAFADAIVDDDEAADSLAQVSIALAVMYLAAFLVEIFGIIGVSAQRLALVRTYLYLTILSTLTVCAAAVLRGVAYFTFAEELVYECITLAVDGRAADKALFRTHPWPAGAPPMTFSDARKQCVAAWVHASWPVVLAVFLFGVLPALAHLALVAAYARQAASTTHPASLLLRAPHAPVRTGGGAGGNGGNGYAALAGGDADSPAPRGRARRTHVRAPSAAHTSGITTTAPPPNPRGGLLVPGTKRTSPAPSSSLQRARRPPPLARSPSPVGLGRTPGPPSYQPSRVYAAFAAPVGAGAGGW